MRFNIESIYFWMNSKGTMPQESLKNIYKTWLKLLKRIFFKIKKEFFSNTYQKQDFLIAQSIVRKISSGFFLQIAQKKGLALERNNKLFGWALLTPRLEIFF